MESKVVLAKLKEMGEFVKSDSSMVESRVAREVRAGLPVNTTGGPTIDGPPGRQRQDEPTGPDVPDLRPDSSPGTSLIPITIYLSDATIHARVEAAVEDLIVSAGGFIEQREDPVLGSWFRRMRAKTSTVIGSSGVREVVMAAAHAADLRVALAQDATVTATMLQNLGPVIEALQPTKDAVLRVGALLIVKVDWTIVVHQLTAAQQLLLDHRPQLATSPAEILTALELKAETSSWQVHPREQHGMAPPQASCLGEPATPQASAT